MPAGGTEFIYPFGRAVGTTEPSADGPRPTFVLGAYPSALHVHWKPPPALQKRGITALAVADEPEPFWDGAGADLLIDRWKAAVGFDQSVHGSVGAARANGDSGRALDDHYLAPLGVERADCWITDCLTTYRLSGDGRTAIAERFAKWASGAGLPEVSLPVHPTEGAIVREALSEQRDRLVEEFDNALPERVITLGNAALRVLKTILELDELPESLDAVTYGRPILCTVGGSDIEWLALAHPGAIQRSAKWRDAHSRWERLRRLQLREGGRLYQRVHVSGAHGDWPEDTPHHVVDAVHFPDHSTPGFVEWQDHQREFEHDVRWFSSAVLTARAYHDRPLLGELIGGRELLSRSYPDHALISCRALSQKPEANIDWVYRRHGIVVDLEEER